MFHRGLRIWRPVLAPILIGALLALACVSAAVAAAPSVGVLNPEPPDTYTCTPGAGGTVCRAHLIEPYTDVPVGIVCGFGDSTIEILDTGTRVVDATRWYDRDGNLTRRLRMNAFHDAYLTNPATGQKVGYSQHNADDEVLTIPGDFDSVTFTSSGHLSIRMPGYGAVTEAGHVVVEPDGTVDAQAGPSELSDYFAGDTAAGDDLCAALGTPNP
jgi:hypothetical protein